MVVLSPAAVKQRARRTRSPWPIILIGLRVLYKERPTHNLKRQYLIVPDSSLLVRRPLWAANTTESSGVKNLLFKKKKKLYRRTFSPHETAAHLSLSAPKSTKDLINDFSLQPIFANREKYAFKLFPSPGRNSLLAASVNVLKLNFDPNTHTKHHTLRLIHYLVRRADFSAQVSQLNRGKQT
jgi:hypothetical protein